VEIDPQTGIISVFSQEWVEKEGEEPELVEKEITPENFGRIAAQTAKQVILQRIREAEREKMYQEYIDREGDIVTGIVEQSDQRYTLVNLGRVEALLPPTEQVPTERYDHGTRLKTYIVEVRRTTKEPQIIVSRTHPSLLRRLFELEVPEIYEGYVEIKSVAREPGYRSKIAVASRDASIDPVGACVGPKGSRVRMVVSELRGEKIDVVEWSEDPERFVANALSPAKVKDVKINEADHTAAVVVPDNQLSLAIGKEGQNARLAAKLTGWRIDIKSEAQAKENAEATSILAVPDEDLPVSEASSLEEGTLEVGGYMEDDGTCRAVKSSGECCTNKARPGSKYCGVHKKLEDGE
jgi:N utilization substance protein A